MTAVYIDYLNRFDIEECALTDDEILQAIEESLAMQGNAETSIEPRTHIHPRAGVEGHFNVLRGWIGGEIDSAGTKGGASAGLVPMQKTIAALLAESRFYAQPAGIDAMVVSDMVEDVAPQSLLCAQMLEKQLVALRSLIGIEALTAAQALDLRKPKALGAASKILHAAIRKQVAVLEEDRAMGTSIENTLRAIEDDSIIRELRLFYGSPAS